jgi:hypothetical protein
VTPKVDLRSLAHPIERIRMQLHLSRRALVTATAALATAATLAAYALASTPNQGNRLEAGFTTSVAVVNNQIATYGIIQVIATGSGTVEGFGPATLTAGLTQDRTVTTCGPGSGVDQIHYRIVTADGTLILRVSSTRCLDADGAPVGRGTFVVDGAASSGVFADATGDGDFQTIVGPTSNRATFSGKLKVAG